jgi:uncharacterized protein YndB with AHSA1/START domain
MAKVTFVGFQESIEIPDGFEQLEIEEELTSELSKDQLFMLLSDPSKLTEWFYEVSAVNLRPGGKLDFIDDEGQSVQGTCTSVILGKELSYISDAFGNFTARVEKSGQGSLISLSFKILTGTSDVMSKRILQSLDKLRALIS